MPRLDRRTLITAPSAVGLIGLNLLFDVVCLWWLEGQPPPRQALLQLFFGVLVGQVMLIGLWLGLGDGRWYVRLVVAIATTLGVARTIGWAEVLESRTSVHTEPSPWAIIAFVLIAMMLAAALVAFWLRRFRGWRLTIDGSGDAIAARQFQLQDVLLWTLVISGSLAALKFVTTIDESFADQLVDIAIFAANAGSSALAALIAAFARRKLLALIALAGAVLAIATAAAAPEVYQGILRAQAAVNGPIAISVYVTNALGDGGDQMYLAVGAALGSLLNCWILRATGWRLVRPGAAQPTPMAVFDGQAGG